MCILHLEVNLVAINVISGLQGALAAHIYIKDKVEIVYTYNLFYIGNNYDNFLKVDLTCT